MQMATVEEGEFAPNAFSSSSSSSSEDDDKVDAEPPFYIHFDMRVSTKSTSLTNQVRGRFGRALNVYMLENGCVDPRRRANFFDETHRVEAATESGSPFSISVTQMRRDMIDPFTMRGMSGGYYELWKCKPSFSIEHMSLDLIQRVRLPKGRRPQDNVSILLLICSIKDNEHENIRVRYRNVPQQEAACLEDEFARLSHDGDNGDTNRIYIANGEQDYEGGYDMDQHSDEEGNQPGDDEFRSTGIDFGPGCFGRE